MKLTRRPLKTVRKPKKAVETPPPSTAQLDVGAPNVDTFARTGVPNTTYSFMPRR